VKALRWLSANAIIAIHQELVSRYGGVSGLRSPELLDSAIARPKHLAAYKDKVTVPQLAASYAWGLMRNHPFVDGNKRVALAAAIVFLDLNGWDLDWSEAEETAMVLQAAAGGITEQAWSRWVQKNAKKMIR
jgi:death-on-curing protein